MDVVIGETEILERVQEYRYEHYAGIPDKTYYHQREYEKDVLHRKENERDHHYRQNEMKQN